MKISKSTAYLYCQEGRYGGQIPTVSIDLGGKGTQPPDIVDMPDEWFIKTNGSFLPTTGYACFMYWSRRGLRENKKELRRQFKTALGFRSGEHYDYGLTFEQWLAKCEEDNVRIDEAASKAKKAALKKLDQIQHYNNK